MRPPTSASQKASFGAASWTGESSWCPGAELNHRHTDFQSHVSGNDTNVLDSPEVENPAPYINNLQGVWKTKKPCRLPTAPTLSPLAPVALSYRPLNRPPRPSCPSTTPAPSFANSSPDHT